MDNLFFNQILQVYAEEFRPCVKDTVCLLNESLKEGKNVLVEGANAAMLDIDFGNFNHFY